MTISSLDHVALPILNVQQMLAFYEALGLRIDSSMEPLLFSAHLSDQKINFHAPRLWKNARFKLKGPTATPGCGDLCFVWSGTVHSLMRHLQDMSTAILEGPVARRGGRDSGTTEGVSVYIRDPDQNLVEFICYDSEP